MRRSTSEIRAAYRGGASNGSVLRSESSASSYGSGRLNVLAARIELRLGGVAFLCWVTSASETSCSGVGAASRGRRGDEGKFATGLRTTGAVDLRAVFAFVVGTAVMDGDKEVAASAVVVLDDARRDELALADVERRAVLPFLAALLPATGRGEAYARGGLTSRGMQKEGERGLNLAEGDPREQQSGGRKGSRAGRSTTRRGEGACTRARRAGASLDFASGGGGGALGGSGFPQGKAGLREMGRADSWEALEGCSSVNRDTCEGKSKRRREGQRP